MKTSKLEAKFIELWSRRGLLGGPAWVAELPEPEREVRFHPVRKWRFDFAWPAYRVAVEIDGGTWTGQKSHASGPGIAADIEKSNAAVDLGWRILKFTGADLRGKQILQTIQTVANLLHQGKVLELPEQLPLF